MRVCACMCALCVHVCFVRACALCACMCALCVHASFVRICVLCAFVHALYVHACLPYVLCVRLCLHRSLLLNAVQTSVGCLYYTHYMICVGGVCCVRVLCSSNRA